MKRSRTTAKIVSGSGVPAGGFGLELRHDPHQPHPDLQVASRLGRMAAFGLDSLLLPLALFFLPVSLLVVFAYMALKGNAVGAGRSLGRAAVGHRLLTRDGQEASHGLVVARNAVRFMLWMTFIPFIVDLGLLVFGDGRLLADRIFGTRVFQDPEKVRAERRTPRQQIVDHVAAESARWDERHDQVELEEIADRLGDEDSDLAAFEERLASQRAPAFDFDFEPAPAPQVTPQPSLDEVEVHASVPVGASQR